ncbi:MAG: hypothetical protein V1871_02025 [Planctomycetota bacterium]
MSETVFILGAGASKEAGAPLMSEFLSVADNLRRSNTGIKSIFDKVLNIRNSLQAALSKSYLKLDDIEAVFAALEMGRLIGHLPGIQGDEIGSLISSMKQMIVKTLESSIVFPAKDKQIFPPESYNTFVKLVKAINNNGNQNSCSIITFNYDIALDYALHFNLYPPNYCLDNSTSGATLLKLHGSINWAKCSNCDKIIPGNVGDFAGKIRIARTALDITSQVYFNIGSELQGLGLKHCDTNVSPDPVIIPPTWNKQQYHNEISQVWARAAKELSDAENIFVIGYSLPPSDYFFHYLYALGSINNQVRIKRFWICDPDPNVAERFRKIIGPDVDNNKFTAPSRAIFSQIIYTIANELKVKIQ